MDAQKFRQTLTEIHNELDHATSVDNESRRLLIEVLHDIERLLAGENRQEDHPEYSGMLGRLRKSVEQFEESHPFLAGLVGRMADGLSNMGI